ncbi:MAG: uroporphyrinogen-III synthase [Anaerolineae bacterium]|nr:uroporphyrinogen-III synthase [Anaerolineae bacterium]
MMSGLVGKRIVNTRAVHQAEALNILLRQHDAIPLDYPCIAITPPDDPSLLDAALFDLTAGNFEWLILTSANTVFAIAERLAGLGLTLNGRNFQTAVIGPATAEAARQNLGLEVADLPAEYIAESLVNHLPLKVGERVLLPESTLARPTLTEHLTARGANVTVVTAYQTVRGTGGVNIAYLLTQGQVDILTFTSSSTVTYFVERLQNEGGRLETALAVPAACIGPKTATTAQAYGFPLVDVPSEHSLEGLVAILETYFASTERQL